MFHKSLKLNNLCVLCGEVFPSTQIIISKSLGYAFDVEDLLNEVEVLRKMTLNFIKHLKRKKISE